MRPNYLISVCSTCLLIIISGCNNYNLIADTPVENGQNTNPVKPSTQKSGIDSQEEDSADSTSNKTTVSDASWGTLNNKQKTDRNKILDLAKSFVGFSYFWGGGPLKVGVNKGVCTPNNVGGGCPNCKHSGTYGADCSGFVARVWGITSLESTKHGPSTSNFVSSSLSWTQINRSSVLPGDAFAYNTSGRGHIMIYEKGDAWGTPSVYESRGCAYGIVYNSRSVSSTYKTIRLRDLTNVK